MLASQTSLHSAKKYCTTLASTHYENFPVGSFWMDPNLREDIHAIYAFARTADDFADEKEHEGVRLERLQMFRELLMDAKEGRASDPLFLALSKTIRKHSIPVKLLDDLLVAFEQDVRQNRHETFESIVEYAKKSANPVGRLVLWVHGIDDEHLLDRSDDICSALQFANFWQDVGVDLDKDRIYLPLEDLKKFHVSVEELKLKQASNSIQDLLRFQVDRTWEWFERGKPLCEAVSGRLKIELKLVWLGGTRILEKIEQNQFDVFRKRPTLKKWDQLTMLVNLLRWRS